MTTAGPWVALGLVVALASGCADVDHDAGESRISSSGSAVPTVRPVTVEPPTTAATQLAALRVGPRRPPVGYDREAFGPAWDDVDGNGCNQRDDVLLRDAVAGSVTVGQQGACDHDVLAGTWVDPYTGRTLVETDMKDPAQAQAVQIDHVVPLAEAWASGASGWSADRRAQFANDLSELLAVDGPTNASKGDDDPAAWRPRRSFQCQYAVRWIQTKTRWDLTIDRPERRALGDLLATC